MEPYATLTGDPITEPYATVKGTPVLELHTTLKSIAGVPFTAVWGFHLKEALNPKA